jgi:hypothetical protein
MSLARIAMPLVDDLRALVDERVDEALDDLLVADLARRDAELGAVLLDHVGHDLARDRVALAGQVVVPAGAGLLAEATHLAQQVGGLRVADVGLLDVAALADVPADVVAGEVAHPERPHRHAELLHRLVDLLRGRAFLEQVARLARVLLDHAVADEAVGDARDDARLLDLLAELHHGREDVLRGLRAADDLEQLHHVGRG